MNYKMKTNFAGLALLAVGGLASASPCDQVISGFGGYNDAVTANDPIAANNFLSNHPECFAGSATTSRVQINSTSLQQANAISTGVGARFGDTTPRQQALVAARSMAAGGQGAAWSTWGSLNNNDTRQSYQAVGGTVRNDNKITNIIFGGDYALSPTMAVGVSVAFDSGSGSGSNTGDAANVNDLSSKGFAIAPYFGMQIDNTWALDASIGLGKGEIAMSSTTAGSLNVNTDADRRFAAVNLSYNRWSDKVQWTGKLGYLHGEEVYADSNISGASQTGTTAKNTLGQLRLSAQAGYWMDGFMPYAGLAYTSDLHRSTTQFGASTDPIGKNAVVWTLGVNFFSLKSGVTGGIAYSQEEGRTNQKNDTLLANLNVRF